MFELAMKIAIVIDILRRLLTKIPTSTTVIKLDLSINTVNDWHAKFCISMLKLMSSEAREECKMADNPGIVVEIAKSKFGNSQKTNSYKVQDEYLAFGRIKQTEQQGIFMVVVDDGIADTLIKYTK
ncbi:hypothetical protein IWW36_001026 [Coemansia brasiliensis]|uniref:Uncharacterized protein n=1 Tax=Coemansia brasiliensis TaxID=2650707 RepID=A0A9W8ICH4_9FUNG|nr:hypothetical protein IWW36_001026 [Coemansia brasiliensis]